MTATADVTTQLKLSVHADLIAGQLGDALQIMVGVSADKRLPYHQMNRDVKLRLRRLADEVVANLDPDRRVNLMAAAVDETVDWMDGPYGGPGTEPTPREIAQEAVSRFLALEVRS